MPIVGLTDVVTPRLPSLGKLRKGAEKPERGPGRDLEYFRFDGVKPEINEAFEAVYGSAPGALTVYLPFQTADENFATWQEEWAAGGLVHRCDGRSMTIWREGAGFTRGAKPCPYYTGEKKRSKTSPGCDEVGRLQVLLPELIKAGHVGTVTLETHSKHDMLNILGVLKDVEARGRDLRGVPFTLCRRQMEVSTPTDDGGRVTRKKWLVFIEPAAAWVQVRLAIAHASAMALPSGDVIDAETGEILESAAPLPQIAAPASNRIDAGPDFDQPAKPSAPVKPAASQPVKPATPKAPARPSQTMWDKFDDLVAEAQKLGIKAPDYDVAEISADDLAKLGAGLRAAVTKATEQQAAQAARGATAEPDTSPETETKPAAAKPAKAAAAQVPAAPSADLRKRFDAVAKVACQVLGFESIFVPDGITAAQLTEMGTVIKEQTDAVKGATGADARMFAIAMAKLLIIAFEARWRGLIGAGWTPSPQWKQADLVNQYSQLSRKIEDAKAKEKRDVREPVAA